MPGFTAVYECNFPARLADVAEEAVRGKMLWACTLRHPETNDILVIEGQVVSPTGLCKLLAAGIDQCWIEG